MKCRCGKQLFGKATVEAEYRRQKIAWKASVRGAPPVNERPSADRSTGQHQDRLREKVRQVHGQSLQVQVEYEAQYTALVLECSTHVRTNDEIRRLLNVIHIDSQRLGLLAKDIATNLDRAETDLSPPNIHKLVGVSRDIYNDLQRLLPGITRRTARIREIIRKNPAPAPSTCTWEPCNNNAREESKYCSRACSNKNAWSRHRKRNTAKKEKPPRPVVSEDTPIGDHPEDKRVLETLDVAIAAGPEPDVSLPWEGYHQLPEAGLWDQPLIQLRKYAFQGLGIIGASKILGGKSTLIDRIVEARKREAAA